VSKLVTTKSNSEALSSLYRKEVFDFLVDVNMIAVKKANTIPCHKECIKVQNNTCIVSPDSSCIK
jgi:hypothetical protein